MAVIWVVSGCLPRGRTGWPRRLRAGSAPAVWPADRDRVQADDQAQAFDLAGDADHGGQDVDAVSGPVVALSVDLGVPASCGVREGNN